MVSCLLAAGAGIVLWRHTVASSVPVLPAGLMAGDVVFMEGTSWRADLVRLFQSDHADYSHVGIVVPSAQGWMVAHADPDKGCCCESWENLRSALDVRRVVVRRCPNLSPQQREQAASAAARYAAERIPFDHAFDGTDAGKLYCTELIARAYAAAGFPKFLEACAAKPLFPNDLEHAGTFVEVPFPVGE